ncbi:phosphoribosylglycinamide formyltransferase [Timonella sp. A28]|uniref:phosphoribosylglycinamide formyltransferase n=1 Tax=Timonella sp. A28 TaxID=3442640 RepID=UPI003EBE5EB1
MTTTPSGHLVNTIGQDEVAAKKVVVLVSGGGSNFAALLAAHGEPSYGARIVAVITDNPHAGALTIADEEKIPSVIVDPKDFATRAEWNVALAEAVRVFQPDLVVSAGFMRILGKNFLDSFAGKTINTHPALLPSFPGAHGVRDALAYGVKITGCTLHVVDEGTDTGPIIAQAVVAVEPADTEETLHERIKEKERELIVTWVSKLARYGFTVEGRTVALKNNV